MTRVEQQLVHQRESVNVISQMGSPLFSIQALGRMSPKFTYVKTLLTSPEIGMARDKSLFLEF